MPIKDQIKLAEYRNINREHINEVERERRERTGYYTKRRETYIECESCGYSIKKHGLSEHKKTMQHILYLKKWELKNPEKVEQLKLKEQEKIKIAEERKIEEAKPKIVKVKKTEEEKRLHKNEWKNAYYLLHKNDNLKKQVAEVVV